MSSDNLPESIAGLRVLARETVGIPSFAYEFDFYGWPEPPSQDTLNENMIVEDYYLLEHGVVIGVNVGVGSDVTLGFGCIIECGSTLGDGVTVGAFAHIYDSCQIDDGAEIHPYAAISPETLVGAGAIIRRRAFVGSNNEVPPGAVVADSMIIAHEAFAPVGEDADKMAGDPTALVGRSVIIDDRTKVVLIPAY